ncbi:hypothetical protein ACP275_14G327700 [Erythranthe tilingii]
MDCRKLEITVVSANNLEDVRVFFGKTAVHARVSINGKTETERRTPTDTHGSQNPSWEFTTTYIIMETMLQSCNAMLVVKLYCDRNAGDRYIGEVYISLMELFECAKYNGGDEKSSNQVEPADEDSCCGRRSAVMTLPVMKGCVQSQGALKISYSFSDKVSFDQLLMAENVAPLII